MYHVVYLAERFGWGHDEVVALYTDDRLFYVDEVIKMYEKEAEAYEKK